MKSLDGDPVLSALVSGALASRRDVEEFIGLTSVLLRMEDDPERWESECVFNQKYQSLIDSISDSRILKEEETFVRLSALAAEFRETAMRCGKIIIAEKDLPYEEKTIKPCTR